MTMARMACFSLVATCLAALPVYAQTPVPLVNADFEAGLAGWTVFTTANGTVGPAPLPTTTAAEINDKPASQAAMFVAGQRSYTPGVEEGGGVFQWFQAPAGTITVSADVAGLFHVNRDASLSDSARFWLVIDGQIVSRLDLGPMKTTPYVCTPIPTLTCLAYLPGTVEAVLSGSASVGPGPHYVMIAITRERVSVQPDPAVPFFVYHFLDNVTVTWTDGGSQ